LGPLGVAVGFGVVALGVAVVLDAAVTFGVVVDDPAFPVD
jgi:hypothetical protein